MSITRIDEAIPDPAGAQVTPVGPKEVDELQKLLAASGLPEMSLQGRYSVVFMYPGIGAGGRYPELTGCTAELCTFADQTTEFVKHGIQLAGLSTQPTEPPGDFLGAFPFLVGRIPVGSKSPLVDIVTKDDETYAKRRSFVVFPDATGAMITNIKDPVGHVGKCFQTAIDRRLAEYRQAALSFFQQDGGSMKSRMAHTGFLANGADSVSISTIDFEARLVAKMASPAIVIQEGGYMKKINSLLSKSNKPPLFPGVVAIRDDQHPAYYLMEAANPVSLDHLLFTDETMTELRNDRLHLMTDALNKLGNLYELTFRPEVPRVAHYHYVDRFEAITQRADFIDTHDFLFGASSSLDELLAMQFVIDGDYVCRSFREQLDLLHRHGELLAQPVGAYLHGDVHLKNMLVSEDGSTVIYVDPRVVWDGHDVGDPGFGDPLYDLGTLLHSLHSASAILRAIDAQETAALLKLEEEEIDGARSVVVWPGVLRISASRTIDWFTDWIETTIPAAVLGDHWRARLHVTTANAQFGWLKYARAVKTRDAWLAHFAAVLYHLERGARYLEAGSEEVRP